MRLLTKIFAVIGFVTVAFAIIGMLVASHMRGPRITVSDQTILTLNVGDGFKEVARFDPLSFSHDLSLRDIINAIGQAADDDRIQGLLIFPEGALPLAQAQELRTALIDFRAKGKHLYAYADTYGELESANGSFYLASICDKVWIQPMGVVGLTGIAADELFARGALDRNGVDPEISKRAEYKTAFDMFTEKGFTAANREMTQSLLNDAVGQLVAGIAEARKLPLSAVRAAMDTAPINGEDAVKMKLLDAVLERGAVLPAVFADSGGEDTLSVKDYASTLGDANHKPKKGDKIALIYATGLMTRGSGFNPMGDEDGTDPRSIYAAFKDATDDETVKAIIFRVNSPGGSVVASETIREGVAYAKEKNKIVVASMGEVAGSGGYWVLAGADRILAEPATLTGSIGVLGGKPVIAKLLNSYGINVDGVAVGKYAAMFSPLKAFTPDEKARQEQMLDTIYTDFMGVVATGRHMPLDKVKSIAKGRVWTGKQAKDIGLVDELGGLEQAIKVARSLAKIPDDVSVPVETIPAPQTMEDYVRGLVFGDSNGGDDSIRLDHMSLRVFGAAFKAIVMSLQQQTKTELLMPYGKTMR